MSGPAKRGVVVIRRLASAAMTLVVALVVLVAIMPRVAPVEFFFVRSPSMAPTLPVGTLLVSERVAAADVRVGDVLTFSDPNHAGQMVTHRVVDIDRSGGGDLFVTKGDANTNVDSWRVPAVGSGWRLRAAVPVAGYVLGIAQGLLAGGAVAPLLIGVAAFVMLRRVWASPAPRPDPAAA